MFHVLVETAIEDGWSEFLSFNTTQPGVRMLLAHAAKRQTDDTDDAAYRITVGPENANAPQLPSDSEVTMYLESNW